MGEIKFKPSIKPDLFVFGLILGVILFAVFILAIANPAFLAGFLGVLVYILFFGGALIFAIIGKLFTTYTITDDNEIIINYKFLSTATKLYRVDQITSVTLKQGFFNKMLGYGTVKFGIFGKTSMQTSAQNNQKINLSAVFSDIKDYGNAFEKITQQLGIDIKNEIYSQKPKTAPSVLSIIISSLFLMSGLILVGLFTYNMIILLVGAFLSIIGFFSLIGSVFTYFRIRKTNYKFMEKSFLVSHNYFFSRMREVVPYKRITNVQSSRNIFSYALFRILKYNIYTGGDRDPILSAVPDDKLLGNLFSYVVESDSNIITNKTVKSIEKNISNPEIILKPGKSFFIGSIVRNVFLFLIFLIVGLIVNNYFDNNLYLILIILGIILPLVFSIFRYIIWKNISYELYDEKIVRISGVLTMQRKEVFLRNIKYIGMDRPYLFQKVLGEGTIHIYTAGTGGVDNSLERIKDAPKYYKILKNALLEE